MTTDISKIINSPVVFHNRHLTVNGVVRTVCERPFPHFTIEDRTGTVICKSMNGLPGVGAHVQITGEFVIDIPTDCTIPVPRLNETERAYVGHPSMTCTYIGCEFTDNPAVAA